MPEASAIFQAVSNLQERRLLITFTIIILKQKHISDVPLRCIKTVYTIIDTYIKPQVI